MDGRRRFLMNKAVKTGTVIADAFLFGFAAVLPAAAVYNIVILAVKL